MNMQSNCQWFETPNDVNVIYMISSSVLSDFRDPIILDFKFYSEYVCASDYFAGICIVWYVLYTIYWNQRRFYFCDT